MPTRNVNLTPELDRAVEQRVKSGRYENASEVVRAALRALDQQEQENDLRLKRLERDLDEGDASEDFKGDPFEAAFQELSARPPAKKKQAKRRG